jgi:hypothetical protein
MLLSLPSASVGVDLETHAPQSRDLPRRAIMGKLNIAHHKSYHPYRRDNIEKVRRDEEQARIEEDQRDGRMMLAVRIWPASLSTMRR